MSLVRCPECGRERVSSTASCCPSCGFDLRAYFEAHPDALTASSPVSEPNPLTLSGTVKLALFQKLGESRAKSALRRIPKSAPGRLLLMGCGSGALVEATIRRTQCHIVAGDLSASQIKRATKWNLTYLRGGRLEFFQGNPAAIPKASPPFDYILVTNQCHRWPDLPDALCRLTAALAPGGTLLFALTSPASAAQILDTPVVFDAAKLAEQAAELGLEVSSKEDGKILELRSAKAPD